MKFGMQVGLGPGHIVIDGDPAPPPSKGVKSPQFSAHIYCGQTAAWIKMPLGMEVAGHIVLDGDWGPTSRPLIFSAYLLWPMGWMHQDATW